MNKEISTIINELQIILEGDPWYGRSVYAILNEVDEGKAFIKPSENSASLVELLYHMLTWAEFTLKRIEKDKINDMKAFEKLDWREIDPQIHGWDEALASYIATHQQIIAHLQSKDDGFLDEKVDYRDYNFRYLINGMLQHNIYHLGQIAYLKKMLDN